MTKTETDVNVKLGDKSDDNSKFDNSFGNLGFFRPQYDCFGVVNSTGLTVYASGWTLLPGIGCIIIKKMIFFLKKYFFFC